MFKKVIRPLALLLLAFATNAIAAPVYNPFGPQQSVSVSTVLGGGWTQCYSATMNVFIGSSAENVLSKCSGDYLMMAGRMTGSDTLLLLAQTTFDDATFNTGTGTQNTHNSNGTDWYFAPNWSWGFTNAGAGVALNQCDTRSDNANRMCLHTVNGAGGYRIGDFIGLNGSTNFEKVFFVANEVSTKVPEPATITLFGLGLLGFAVSRKRKISKH
ncbi:MAG TPA: PEP-CTERM sorting domain-containing protein [Noviherbaspirillum sp.]|uniref:PEP-CTERM sorting domain-containing protein n=1 Tax=Noviherbaspirillum sp. TaxID=1926288 RepID=UPI002DDD639B|nr:PEP-CTERM sorting domain-containing protein [Noviherbaspirillum sp.]HEV2612081.1 PEP-CTERM sorting domain-containing protein [Noviherbaspirillum sp.]